MAFTVHTTGVAQLASVNVVLQPLAGAYELTFISTFDVSQRRETVYWARVHCAHIQAVSSKGRLRLGTARPAVPTLLIQNDSNHPVQVHLNLTVQAHDIARLDGLRDGGDLQFDLQILGEGSDKEGRVGIQPVHEQKAITVPRSEWLKRLNEARFADTLLIEVSMPNDFPAASEVGVHLRRAHAHFLNASYRECVAECRPVIEVLGRLQTGDEDWSADVIAEFKANQSQMSKHRRELAIAAAVRHYVHQAHHASVEGGSTTYTRGQAWLILTTTAALVARYLTNASL